MIIYYTEGLSRLLVSHFCGNFDISAIAKLPCNVCFIFFSCFFFTFLAVAAILLWTKRSKLSLPPSLCEQILFICTECHAVQCHAITSSVCMRVQASLAWNDFPVAHTVKLFPCRRWSWSSLCSLALYIQFNHTVPHLLTLGLHVFKKSEQIKDRDLYIKTVLHECMFTWETIWKQKNMYAKEKLKKGQDYLRRLSIEIPSNWPACVFRISSAERDPCRSAALHHTSTTSIFLLHWRQKKKSPFSTHQSRGSLTADLTSLRPASDSKWKCQVPRGSFWRETPPAPVVLTPTFVVQIYSSVLNECFWKSGVHL